MHWLWSNKEWLFSGIALAAIGVLFRLFVRGHTLGNSAAVSADRNSSVFGAPVASGSNITQTVNIGVLSAVPAEPQTQSVYSEKPTPVEIRKHLRGLPVYQRGLTKDSYVGLRVRWRVVFSSMDEESDAYRAVFKTDATHDIMAFYESGGERVGVSTHVVIDRFPRLKIIHENTPMQMSGQISHVSDTGSIRLKDVDITFD